MGTSKFVQQFSEISGYSWWYSVEVLPKLAEEVFVCVGHQGIFFLSVFVMFCFFCFTHYFAFCW